MKEIRHGKGKYKSKIDFDIDSEDSSPTSFFLLEISSTLRQSLPSLLIQNIVTSSVCNRSTIVQIALAVLIGEKQSIENLYDYSITCSYNAFLRYKTYAAFTHNKNRVLDVLSRNGGLVKVVADNFDLLISSQNGLKQTHDLAMILTQYSSSKKQEHLNFTRLPKLALKDIEVDDTPITFYKVPKNPKMPLHEVANRVLPLKVLAHQKVALHRSQEQYFSFFMTWHRLVMYLNIQDTTQESVEKMDKEPSTTVLYTPPKANHQLKDTMKVEVSKRSTKAVDVIVLDGCAILQIFHWPENRKLLDYVTSLVHKVSFYLTDSDVFLILDRYYEYSPKSSTRKERVAFVNQHRTLWLSSPLSSQNTILKFS